MQPTITGLCLLLALLLAGCVDSDENPSASDATSAPAADNGAETSSDEGDSAGISLKLDGVEINVNEEDGIQVEAPGTSVSVNREGVDINANDVEIKTTPESDSEAPAEGASPGTEEAAE